MKLWITCWAVALAGGTIAAADTVAEFTAECGRQAAAAVTAGQTVVRGRDGWLFLPAELRHVAAGRFWGADAKFQPDPLAAIVDYNTKLKQAGIELIFVPVPPKAAIYPDGLVSNPPPAAARVDFHAREFFDALTSNGVSVLDLTPLFLAARQNPAAPALYCHTDTHWSPYACQLVASNLAAMIRGKTLAADLRRQEFALANQEITIQGDLLKMLGQANLPGETLPLRAVTGATDDKASPVLLLGDSHCLVYHIGGDMHATGAGLADQLAAELGIGVDCLGERGSGATPSRVTLYRRAKAEPGYLQNKKVMIWCLSAREFTETPRWSLVPVTPAP